MKNCSSGWGQLNKLFTTITSTWLKSQRQVNFESISFTFCRCLTLAVGQYSECNSNLTHHMEIFISPWDLFNIRLERTPQMFFFSLACQLNSVHLSSFECESNALRSLDLKIKVRALHLLWKRDCTRMSATSDQLRSTSTQCFHFAQRW